MSAHPVIFADAYLCAQPGLLRLRQRASGLEVEQSLPAAADVPRFACRLKLADAQGLGAIDFSAAPRMGLLSGVMLWVERPPRRALDVDRTYFQATRARPFEPYHVHVRLTPAREELDALVLRAMTSRFVHKPWGVLLDAERALLIAKLLDAWAPAELALGEAERGVMLTAGAFSVLFLDAGGGA